MAEKPIDRENYQDLLKQIGRTEESIKDLNRLQASFDNEINSWPRRLAHLEMRKKNTESKISRKHKYLNELKKDLKNLFVSDSDLTT